MPSHTDVQGRGLSQPTYTLAWLEPIPSTKKTFFWPFHSFHPNIGTTLGTLVFIEFYSLDEPRLSAAVVQRKASIRTTELELLLVY